MSIEIAPLTRGSTVRLTADTAKDRTVHNRRGGCELHGVRCCPGCCKHEGQCDYGACTRPATGWVTVVQNATGQAVERRPGCALDLRWLAASVPAGFTAQIEAA
jgi:hypothetical protein